MEPGDRLHFDITKKYKNKGCREKYKKRDKYRRNGAASKSKVKGSFSVLHNALEGKYGNLRILQSKYSFTADRASGDQHTGEISSSCNLQRGIYRDEAAGTEGTG